MRLSELALKQNIPRKRLRRQLEKFPGVLSRLTNNPRSPIIVNMEILSVYNVNIEQHSELAARIEKLEETTELLTDSLSRLLKEIQ